MEKIQLLEISNKSGFEKLTNQYRVQWSECLCQIDEPKKFQISLNTLSKFCRMITLNSIEYDMLLSDLIQGAKFTEKQFPSTTSQNTKYHESTTGPAKLEKKATKVSSQVVATENSSDILSESNRTDNYNSDGSNRTDNYNSDGSNRTDNYNSDGSIHNDDTYSHSQLNELNSSNISEFTFSHNFTSQLDSILNYSPPNAYFAQVREQAIQKQYQQLIRNVDYEAQIAAGTFSSNNIVPAVVGQELKNELKEAFKIFFSIVGFMITLVGVFVFAVYASSYAFDSLVERFAIGFVTMVAVLIAEVYFIAKHQVF